MTGRKDEDGKGRAEVREKAEDRGRADGTNRKGLVNGRWTGRIICWTQISFFAFDIFL